VLIDTATAKGIIKENCTEVSDKENTQGEDMRTFETLPRLATLTKILHEDFVPVEIRFLVYNTVQPVKSYYS
jgi:hypothetical protein